MGKHPIGGMRSMIVSNRRSDFRFRRKAFLRNKQTAESRERLEARNRKKDM